MSLLSKIARKLCKKISERLPVRLIAREEDVYLERYYICGRPPAYPEIYSHPPVPRLTFLPTIFLHRFARSDVDPELHNHPFAGTSVILAGGYTEERRFPRKAVEESDSHLSSLGWRFTPHMAKLYVSDRDKHHAVLQRTYTPGQINRIQPDTFHRVDLLEEDAWTLFIIGPKVQSWGFWDRWTGEFLPWKIHHARSVARESAPTS